MNLYEESKANLLSLVKQTSHVGLGLITVLLLTKGNPSPLVLEGTFVSGVVYVACAEERRLTNRRKNHE